MHVPNEDVANALAGAGLGLTLGVNLFAGGYQQVQTGVPTQAVFCQLFDGYGPPQRYLQGNYAEAGVGIQAREPRVVVYVRSAKHDYHGGQVLARAAKDALHDVPISGYDAVRVMNPEPLFVSQINDSENIFSFNVHMWIDE